MMTTKPYSCRIRPAVIAPSTDIVCRMEIRSLNPTLAPKVTFNDDEAGRHVMAMNV